MSENIQLYIKLFKAINKSKNGKISRQEFMDAFQNNFVKECFLRENLPEISVNQLFNRIKWIDTVVDEDSECIVYSEFLTAALDLKV